MSGYTWADALIKAMIKGGAPAKHIVKTSGGPPFQILGSQGILLLTLRGPAAALIFFPDSTVYYQFPMEKRQTVGADLRVRPLWAHPEVRPYQKRG